MVPRPCLLGHSCSRGSCSSRRSRIVAIVAFIVSAPPPFCFTPHLNGCDSAGTERGARGRITDPVEASRRSLRRAVPTLPSDRSSGMRRGSTEIPLAITLRSRYGSGGMTIPIGSHGRPCRMAVDHCNTSSRERSDSERMGWNTIVTAAGGPDAQMWWQDTAYDGYDSRCGLLLVWSKDVRVYLMGLQGWRGRGHCTLRANCHHSAVQWRRGRSRCRGTPCHYPFIPQRPPPPPASNVSPLPPDPASPARRS